MLIDISDEKELYINDNKKLEFEYCAFKAEFEKIKQKLLEKRSSSITPKYNFVYLENAKRNIKLYRREHRSLKSLVKDRELKREENLNQEIKSLEERLHRAQKENDRLNRLSFFNNKDPDSNEIVMRNEVLQLNILISSLKETNLNTNLKLSRLKQQEEEIKPILNGLLKQIEPEQVMPVSNNILFEELLNKLKKLQLSFNTNERQLKYKINLLEKELKLLTCQTFSAKTKLYKRNQQKRLIEMSQSEVALQKIKSRTPSKKILLRPDVSFYYKPSISRLYI